MRNLRFKYFWLKAVPNQIVNERLFKISELLDTKKKFNFKKFILKTNLL